MSIKRTLASYLLITALAMGAVSTTARAVTEEEVAAAQAQLEALNTELSALESELQASETALEGTIVEIGKTEEQIAQTNEQLSVARLILSNRMRSSYKAGGLNFLDVIFQSTSIEDFVARIHYMDSIADDDAAAIERVSALSKQLGEHILTLENTKSDQEEQIATTQSQADSYIAKVQEAQAYYQSLDQQLKDQIAEQEKAEQEALQRALEIAEAEEAAAQQREDNEASAQSEESETRTSQTSETTSSSSSSSSTESSSTTSESSSSSSSSTRVNYKGLAALEIAYQYIGWPYVWAGSSPADGGFDCSGLIVYCFGLQGMHGTGYQIEAIQARGEWRTSLDELVPGDLVFPHAGHVGIYVGDGKFLHSPTFGRTVCVQDLYGFYGGGPIV